jgi:Tfp pilus assembly protein PilF
MKPPPARRLSAALALLVPSALAPAADATVSEVQQTLLTYAYGDPSPLAEYGRIYPYARFDGYSASGSERSWTMVKLENDYLVVLIAPQIGGKVWAAYDKVHSRDIIYRNPVVKFRDVGLRGPWTAGGLEFNFGIIGHAPTCASPVDYCLAHDAAGGVSCIVGALDLPSRTEWRVTISLERDQAAFTTEASWSNPTVYHQSCYQWMTAAAEAGDDLVVSHPGEHYLEHGGTPHPWPLDDAGHDLSHYRENAFGESKSYHVIGAQAEWFGGYWSGRGSGYGHWSLFGDKPGQKVWLWSLARDGAIWRDLLTDAPAPQYIEMQSGLMHSQADDSSSTTPFKHAALEPGAGLHWRESWFPLSAIGGLVDASPWGAMNVRRDGDSLVVGICPLRALDEQLRVTAAGALIAQQRISLSPQAASIFTIPLAGHSDALAVELGDHLLSWHSDDAERQRLHRPLTLSNPPARGSAEGLFTAGEEHLRQRDYAAARESFAACLEVEPAHLRALVRIAELRNRQGDSQAALASARAALSLDATDAEANFVYGVANAALGQTADAKDGFAWAARSPALRAAANAQLAMLSMREHDWWRAREYAQRGAAEDVDGLPCRFLLAVIARLSGAREQAGQLLERIIECEPLHHGARFERYLLARSAAALAEFTGPLHGESPDETCLELASRYLALGCEDDALAVLAAAGSRPMVLYWKAYLERGSDQAQSDRDLALALAASPRGVSPSRLEEIAVLQWALQRRPHWKTSGYLGLLLGNLGREAEARSLVDGCADQPDDAVFYLNRSRFHRSPDQRPLLIADLSRAMALDAGEWRSRHLLLRALLDADDAEAAVPLAAEAHASFPLIQALSLDDATVLMRTGRCQEAIALLDQTTILPSEGAYEGHAVYRRASLLAAIALLRGGKAAAAEPLIAQARTWPEHLGSGRPYETDERIEDYLLARCRAAVGDADGAKRLYERVAAAGAQGYGFGCTTLVSALAARALGSPAQGEALLAAWRAHAPADTVYAPWAQAIWRGDQEEAARALADPQTRAPRSVWQLARRQGDFPVIAAIIAAGP